MYRKDYLDKQMEQLGRVLAKLLSDLIGQKTPGESAALAHEILTNELTFGLTDLLAIPDHELVKTLLETQKFDAANLEKLADVLMQIAPTENTDGRLNLYRKSLLLLQYVNVSEKIYSVERNAKIDRINAILKD